MKDRIQGAEGSRIQVKGMEVRALESSNPIFELSPHAQAPRYGLAFEELSRRLPGEAGT
jgi:hypothetical protein